MMSCNFAEDLDAVAVTEMGTDVGLHTTRKVALREKVVHGVRGLMESGDTLPHLVADVAQCYHVVVDSESVQDVEVAQLLTSRHVINWCRTAKPLVPLAIHGRDNCLDVASSVALWGIDDLAALLRRLIYMSLVEFGPSKFYQRWRKQFSVACRADTFSQSDLDWEQLVKSAQPRHEGLDAESIVTIPLSDSVQVFVLANVLRRPIIVLSSNSDSVESATLFERDCVAERADSTSKLPDIGGIYLPLLWRPEDCIRYPVVLGSIAGRFVPLVGQRGGPAVFEAALDIIPVVTSQLEPLHVWFLLDEEEHEAYMLQQRYLNMTEVNLTRSHSIDMVLGARMRYEQLEIGSLSMMAGTALVRPAAAATGPVGPAAGINVPLERQQTNAFPSMSFPSGDLVSVERLPVTGTNQRHPGNIGELSIMNERCHAAGCVNCASSFIYPYCYEHIDRRVVESTVARRPMPTAAPEPSILMVCCQQPGCHNMSSRFVYPYCYEHIESRITGLHHQQQQQQQHIAAPSHEDEYLASVSPDKCIHPQCVNQASVYTYPVCYEHLDFFALSAQMNSSRPAAVVQVPVVVPPSQTQVAKYDEMMADIEARTKAAMAKCRQPNCSNYGNSRCQGMCHECYRQLQLQLQQQQQLQHLNFSSMF